MDLSSLGKTVAKYAPLLGTVLAGAPGAAIGQILATEFGGSIDNPDDLIQRIITDPNAAVKLAEIQSNTKIQLQSLAAQMAENQLKYETQQIDLANQNTADARKTNAETKSIMPEIISVIVLIGFFACIYLVVAFKQDQDDHDVLYMMFGTMSGAFGAVLNYWLGETASSRNKDSMIYNSTPATS